MTQPCVRYSIHDAAFKSNRFCLQSACRSLIFRGHAAEYKIGRYQSQHQQASAGNLLRRNTAHKNKGNDSGQDGGNRISPHFKRPLQAGLLLAEYNQGETDSNLAQAAAKGNLGRIADRR